MYEVELTLNVHDRNRVVNQLEKLSICPAEELTYQDLYYRTSRKLTDEDRELRLRKKIYKSSGNETSWLTLKTETFDAKSRSKPEFETEVKDYEATQAIFERLGYQKDIEYEKNCSFYYITFLGKELEVSLVNLPELPNTYIEIELPTAEWNRIDESFEILYAFLEELELDTKDLTTTTYQEAVRKARMV